MLANTAQKTAADTEVRERIALLPDQLAPGPRPATPDQRGHFERFGQDQRNRRDRLPYMLGRFIPARRTARSGHDPLFGHPDIIENDYYRFLRNPRG